MDYVFAIIMIIISLGIWFYTTVSMTTGMYAEIVCDGKVIQKYPLVQDMEERFLIPEYGYNTISIHEKHVSIIDADCPDRICVKQRAISKTGESIICLPHKLVVRIVGNLQEASEIDAIAN